MKFNYNPGDWYWQKAGGALYSSARQGEVTPDNQQYQDWLAAGCLPTPYPKDEAGIESRHELAKVLAPYGLKVYPLTPEELGAAFSAAINARLDEFAALKDYDNMDKARLAAAGGAFAADGAAAQKAYDDTWAAAIALWPQVTEGELSINEALAQLPPLAWPDAVTSTAGE
jgi:hypothetical protein